jgi:hypothetical protein
MKFRILLRVIAVLQIVLGLAYLLLPISFLKLVGHQVPPPDLAYPLGMLAARFLAYGLGFWIASSDPEKNRLWIHLMALIQAIDLAVGLFYSLNGTIAWSLSAFPMFNALWIMLICAFWRPVAAR